MDMRQKPAEWSCIFGKEVTKLRFQRDQRNGTLVNIVRSVLNKGNCHPQINSTSAELAAAAQEPIPSAAGARASLRRWSAPGARPLTGTSRG